MKFKKILPLVLITFLSACSNQQSRVFYFDTMIDIKLFEGNKQNAKDLEKLFDLYDVLSDNYLPRNMVNVYSINHTNEDLTIDAELYNLLKVAFDVQTKGATYFNPLCGSLAKKWKSSLNGQQILDENTINEELLKISNTTLTFKDNNVVQRIGEAEIDLEKLDEFTLKSLERVVNGTHSSLSDYPEVKRNNGFDEYFFISLFIFIFFLVLILLLLLLSSLIPLILILK